MKEEFFRFQQRALLNWSTLTVEILLTAFLYAITRTLGASENISVLTSCVFALLLVGFGLIFIHRIYPKTVKVSLLDDYLTLKRNEVSKSSTLNPLLVDKLESALSRYKLTTTMSTWSHKESGIFFFSTHKLTKGPFKVIITYVDLKGRHINLTMDNPNKIQALDTIGLLTREVKESQVVTIEEKKEQIEVIDRITQEAFRPKPNKTLLQVLSKGLTSVFNSNPGMDKAEAEAKSLTSLLNNLA